MKKLLLSALVAATLATSCRPDVILPNGFGAKKNTISVSIDYELQRGISSFTLKTPTKTLVGNWDSDKLRPLVANGGEGLISLRDIVVDEDGNEEVHGEIFVKINFRKGVQNGLITTGTGAWYFTNPTGTSIHAEPTGTFTDAVNDGGGFLSYTLTDVTAESGDYASFTMHQEGLMKK